jgi:DNA-binding transcriptional LysR family regulator
VTLELRLLRYFCVVAEELHFGNAAARLYISQPALSQEIKALEEQVGMPLFVRGPRGVQVTPAGETLLEDAAGVVRELATPEQVAALNDGSLDGLRPGARGRSGPVAALPPRRASRRERSGEPPPGAQTPVRRCCAPSSSFCRRKSTAREVLEEQLMPPRKHEGARA